MDVLKPDLFWINKRCYRLTPCQNVIKLNSNKSNQQYKGYVEEDLYNEDNDEDDREILFKSGQYETSFHVPSMFFSHIIGTKGLTKKRIESETNSRIIVPKQGAQGDITVIGKTMNNVKCACRKLDLVVLASRTKIPSTHFICVPFNSQIIKDAYKRFMSDIIESSDIIKGNEKLFIHPDKLHLTITMLSLVDNEDRLHASQTLNDCKESLIRSIIDENDGEIFLHLKGLEIMNDDPSAVDVLYGIVNCNEFQYLADGITDAFAKSNLTRKKTEKVKLHVTLINSKYGINENTNERQKTPFDARKILENFGDYDFGIQKMQEIHLSQRFSTGSDGFYEATTIIKL